MYIMFHSFFQNIWRVNIFLVFRLYPTSKWRFRVLGAENLLVCQTIKHGCPWGGGDGFDNGSFDIRPSGHPLESPDIPGESSRQHYETTSILPLWLIATVAVGVSCAPEGMPYGNRTALKSLIYHDPFVSWLCSIGPAPVA